jgi:hypothetical protein
MPNMNSGSGTRIMVRPRHSHPGVVIMQARSYINVTAEELPMLIEAMLAAVAERENE